MATKGVVLFVEPGEHPNLDDLGEADLVLQGRRVLKSRFAGYHCGIIARECLLSHKELGYAVVNVVEKFLGGGVLGRKLLTSPEAVAQIGAAVQAIAGDQR